MAAGEVLAVTAGALLWDRAFGEPRRLHPLVGFGRVAQGLEGRLNRPGSASRLRGVLALSTLVLPLVAMAAAVEILAPAGVQMACAVLVLATAIGWCSLRQHAEAVAAPLVAGAQDRAQAAVGRMVSRDHRQLDDAGVATAATESVLENGADAVVASLFWYAFAGMPGVVLHRLVNTLDAMWGYRSTRFLHFGWAAARLDDLLNWAPARLTALAYALCGHAPSALRCWRSQARAWDSPNAGPVMAAGAGALRIRLGGRAPYAEGWRDRPLLGQGRTPGPGDIRAAVALLDRAVLLWLAVLAAGTALLWLVPYLGVADGH
ncbi:MAG: adenosylcobinamide-phosphate synthase CbiB [Algiphilus sp.]|uniref:adenosylcobinamide-phosphate synthase CbiB n=1 Tax=Algiphilus sp. TaxID=1872431 RepID=UPI0032EFB896